MASAILESIDFEKVNTLLEGFNKSTGFVTAMLDLEGNMLAKAGWRQICTDFHRVNPKTSKKCTICDTVLDYKLSENGKYHFYTYLNGLVEVAVPITIKGEHIANLFSGQFLFEKPDKQFFEKQAVKYGFDPKNYFQAIENFPVVQKEKVITAVDFLLDILNLICKMTYQKLEQMKLNEAVRKSENILKLFVENSPASIAMFDNNMQYLKASHRFKTDYNLANQELSGRSHYDIFPEISEQWKEIHKRCLAGETISANNDPFPRADGTTDWVRWEIRPWYESENHIGGIILFSEVITAQVEDQQALRESEKYNRMLFEQSAIGLALTTMDGTLVDINLSFATLIGRTIEETLHLTYWEITPEKYSDQEQQQLKSLNETGYYGPYEKEYIHKDGHLVPVSLQGKIIDRNGVKYIWSSIKDITERKRAEEHVKRLNRINIVLRNINQTIVHVRDKQLLLNEACRIAVHDGEFLMAWIGILNPTTNKVDVTASAGKTGDYLDSLNIDLNDKILSSGPTGMAVKTGKNVFSNNIGTDVKMIPWRENALKQGYLSSITLPINVSGKIIGAYTMYSSESGFFDEDEIKLLSEMASDISFALEFIESEKERKQSEEKYRIMFADNPQPMWIFDLETLDFLEINDAAIHHYGYSKEEFLSKTIKDIRPKEDIEALIQNIENSRNTYNPAGQWRHIKKNGDIIFVEIISHTITFNDRKAMHVMVTDITERNHTEVLLLENNRKNEILNEEYIHVNEELLRSNEELLQAKEIAEKSEKKYKLLYNFNPMPMSIFDAQTLEFLSVNEAFCDKYGYTREEFLNMTILQIRPDTEIEKLKQSVSLTDKGITNAGIFLHKKKNGEIIQVEIIRHELMFDNRIAKLVLINDVTDRLKAETALMETQFKLNEAYKLAHIGIWEWETGTDTVTWTEELYHIAGLDPLLPAPTYQQQARLYAPESWKILNTLVERTLKTSEPYQAELELIRPDGEIRYVKAFGGAKQDAKGQIKGLFGTLQDITELKQAEEELNRSMQLLTETEKIGKVGGWDINIDTMDTTWTDEVYTIHEVELNSNQNVEKGINFYTPESRPVIEKAVQRAIELGENFDVELEIITAKGNRRNVHAIGKTDIEHRRVYGFFQDISERKLAEEKIREKDLQFRKLSANLPDLIYQFTRKPDGTYNVPIASEGIRNIFGCSPEDVLNNFTPIGKVIYPDDAARVISNIEYSAEHLTYFTCEFRVQIPGKEIQWIFSRSTPEKLPDGSITWYGFNADITDRKLAEEKLRENNLRLELALQSANMVCWEMDINTGNVIFDTRRSEMLGYPVGKFRHYKDFIALVHPEDSGKAMKAMQRQMDGLEDKYEIEYRILTQSGEYKWFYDIRTIVKKDANGKPLKAVGLVMDITDRKQAEEVLREREYLLSSSQRAAHVGTWSWKVGDATVYWSDETYRIYGLSPEMGPPNFEFFFEIIHPDDRHKMREWPEAVIAGLRPSSVEFRLLRPDGIYRIIRTEGDVVDTIDGVPSRIAGTAYDITERKLAEEEIRLLNERIATATKSARVGIWDWDVVNNQLVWDDQMYALYGLKKDEFKGAYEAWISGLHPDDKEFAEEETRMVLRGEKAYDTEFRVVWPDGSIRFLKAKGDVFRDDAGNPIRMIGVNFDITEQKRAEDEINALNQTLEQRVIERTSQLQELNKELETFTYSVSHDLKAPLRGIDGYSKLLLDIYGSTLAEEAQGFLATIRSSTIQMNQLIEDLLEYSRLERSQMRNEKISIHKLISSITLLYKNEMETGNFTLKTEIPDVDLVADEKGLTIALRNLIENALKFSADSANKTIEMAVEENTTSWIIRVSDQGIGFDMKYSERIFEIFQRLQRHEDYPGTGIGLAMVSKAMKRMQGKAWATSKPGEGSSFYLEIPKNQYYDSKLPEQPNPPG